jgi:hypothetical protein
VAVAVIWSIFFITNETHKEFKMGHDFNKSLFENEMSEIRYCDVCGRQMITSKEGDGYETDTGKQKYKIVHRCPSIFGLFHGTWETVFRNENSSCSTNYNFIGFVKIPKS